MYTLLNKKRKPKKASVFASQHRRKHSAVPPDFEGNLWEHYHSYSSITLSQSMLTSWTDFNKTKQRLDNFTDSQAGQKTLIILYPRRKGEGRRKTLRRMMFHLLHWV